MRFFHAVIVAATLFCALPVQAAPVTAILAGGCFWSMEKAMDQAEGVLSVRSGYSGGSIKNPTYENYNDGNWYKTPHIEVVEVTYDTEKTTYAKLLNYYFRHIDPTDGRGQFCDFGPGYVPAIFVANDEERKIAEMEKALTATTLGKEIAVKILDTKPFWPAEEYHQNYYIKNAGAYEDYALRCGRTNKLQAVWSGHE